MLDIFPVLYYKDEYGILLFLWLIRGGEDMDPCRQTSELREKASRGEMLSPEEGDFMLRHMDECEQCGDAFLLDEEEKKKLKKAFELLHSRDTRAR